MIPKIIPAPKWSPTGPEMIPEVKLEWYGVHRIVDEYSISFVTFILTITTKNSYKNNDN